MGNGKFICIGVCACVVVVIIVMIPVSIFVIAPNVAQSTLANSVISLPNMTMAACATPYAKIWNKAKITVPALPIKADSTILKYNQTVYTRACYVNGGLTPGYCCGSKWTETCMNMAGIAKNDATDEEMFMGWFNFPQMTMSAGDNYKTFDVTMINNMTVVIQAWVVPLFLVRIPASLIMKAEGVSVKTMGLTINGRTMHNEMTCFAVEDPLNAPTIALDPSVCKTEEPYDTQAYTLVCDTGDHIPATTTASPAYIV